MFSLHVIACENYGMLSHQKAHLQVFPLFAALGLGVGACVYSVSRNFLTNPDVR